MSAPVAWIEIVRRVAACVALAAALAAWLTPAPALIRVAPVDFAEMQKRELLGDTRRLPLATYIAGETKDRLISVQGTEWQTFFQAVGDTTFGRAPNADWSARTSRGWSSGSSVYFRPDETPLKNVTGRLNADVTFTYLGFTDAASARYLGLTYQTPRWMLDAAPGDLAFPWRPLGLWLALAGTAIYVLLPRPRHPDDALVYSPFRAVLLPDLLGLFLFGVFFALPIFVLPRASNNTSLLDPEGGWIFLTLFFWLMALAGLAILAVATWYSAYELLMLPDRLSVTHLFGRTECRYGDMVRVGIRIQGPPRGLIAFGILVSLFNWRAIAPTLAASRQSRGIVIECREHRPLQVPLEQLQGVERLLAVLKQHRVPVDPKVEILLNE